MLDILFYVALLLGSFPILLLINRVSLNSTLKYPIAPFLWLIIVSNLYEFVGTTLLKLPSAYWFRLYMLLEFFALGYFYYYLIEKKHGYFFLIFLTTYLVLFSILIFNWDIATSLKTNSYLAIIEIITVYFFSILWLKNIFTNMDKNNFVQKSDFFFVSGILLYLSGTIFLSLLGDSILKNKALHLDDFWILNIIFNIILSIFLIVGVWKIQQK
jgi:hypothetical protein